MSHRPNGELEVSVAAESEIDPDFEVTVIRAMLLSPGFLGKFRTVLTESLFTRPDFGWLCTQLLAFYDEYKQCPERQVLVDLIRRGDYRNRAEIIERIEALEPCDNVEYVSDRVLEWARWQRIVEVVQSDDRSDPGTFGKRVEEASRFGEHLSGGELVMDSSSGIEITEDERPKIPTPWPSLNEKLRGGPQWGDLCIITSFINVGKTTTLVNIGTTALTAGELVCYGTFEDGEFDIRRRFHQCILGFGIEELLEYNEVAKQRLSEFFEQFGGKLFIKRLRSRRSSVDDFASWVRSVSEREGRPVKLAISDYADRFEAPRKRSEDRQEYREIFEECKLMAGDLDLIHWTALQASRSSHNQDVVGLEFTGESIGKVEGADLVLGLGQTAEDVQLGVINMFESKVRRAKKHSQYRLTAEMERQRIYES